MSKPPTIIYKQSVLTEAWNRNQSLYHVYWQKQEHYGVSASALLLWVALGKMMREASLISIYLLRITVSIQYLFHSGVHWLHRYSLWWLTNWAVPVASIEFEIVALCSHQKWSQSWNVYVLPVRVSAMIHHPLLYVGLWFIKLTCKVNN